MMWLAADPILGSVPGSPRTGLRWQKRSGLNCEAGLWLKEIHVKKTRFIKAQIVGILNELDAGTTATELGHKYGVRGI
jgi:hypothetical protein